MGKASLIRNILLATMSLALASCNVTRQYSNMLERRLDRRGLESVTIRNDSLKLHYRVGGQGETVMLIHGFGGDGKLTWRKQIKPLIGEYRLVIPDILWFGESESTRKPSLDLQVDAMFLILDREQLEQVHVCGISYGGFMAFEMARQHAGRLASMTIVDSPGPWFPDSATANMEEEYGVESPGDLFVPDNPEELQRMLDACFARDRKWPRFMYKEIFNLYFRDHRDAKRGLLGELEMNRSDYRDGGHDVEHPSLVIWGKSDRIFPLWAGEALADSLDSNIRVIPKAGHLPNFERAKAFNAAFLNFLERQSSPGRRRED